MWQLLRVSRTALTNYESSTRSLLLVTSRQMVLTVAGAYLLLHVFLLATWPEQIGPAIWLVALCLLVPAGGALALLRFHFVAAHLLWQLGLAGAITLGALAFGRPDVLLCYALLPLIAVVTFGAVGGVACEAAVLLGLWALAHWSPLPLPFAGALTIALGGAVGGAIGWAAITTLLTVTNWALFSYDQVHAHVVLAQAQRAQLANMNKDLDRVNYHLERSNAALVVARAAAERAERFKSEFVTNVSHELRTPLNLIVGFSEVMLTAPSSYGDVPLPPVYRSDMHAIYRAAQHLLALVDDVLDMARIEIGKIVLLREQTEPAVLVAEAADTVREFVAAKSLALRLDVATDLPPLWVDRLRVRQVLLNLLVNAARFTERGWITVAVARGAAPPDAPTVRFRVSDTGRGIPAAELPRMFEAFRTTEQPVSSWHSGTGLGLPISKQFVELHHGAIGVESIEGEGTTFWFELPAAAAPEAQHAEVPQRWAPYVPLRSTARAVVVVHDDARVAALLARTVEGMQVAWAPTLEEGRERARELAAVALILDSAQPVVASDEGTLIIQCPLPSGHRAALALGAAALLVKPVERHELLATIGRLPQQPQRVLIVDDDAKMVRLLHRMLRSAPLALECEEAYGADEALDLMRQQRPDLVLLDLVMPERDGFALLDAMQADEGLAAVPVVVISAQGQEHINQRLGGAIRVSAGGGFPFSDVSRAIEALVTTLSAPWELIAPTAPAPAADPPA